MTTPTKRLIVKKAPIIMNITKKMLMLGYDLRMKSESTPVIDMPSYITFSQSERVDI